jgi:uncharacterized membrane protein
LEEFQQPRANSWLRPGKTNLQAIYILYLLGLWIFLLPQIAGVVLAYRNRGRSEDWARTHYDWVIRTFWLLMLSVLGSFLIVMPFIFESIHLAIFALGLVAWAAALLLYIVRTILGLLALNRDEPVNNPRSWVL